MKDYKNLLKRHEVDEMQSIAIKNGTMLCVLIGLLGLILVMAIY